MCRILDRPPFVDELRSREEREVPAVTSLRRVVDGREGEIGCALGREDLKPQSYVY